MDTNQTVHNSTVTSLTAFEILAATTFTITSLIGLLVYALVLAVLFIYFRDFKSNFYYIVISLSVADISYLALILFYVVPCTILQRHIWAPYDYGAGLLECLAYISQCVHLTFIAIGRLAYASASSMAPERLDMIFQNGVMVLFWIIFLWLVSAGIAMPIKLIGCDLIYHYEALDFMRDCRNRISDQATHRATIADAVISGLLPVLIAVLHVLTWLVVYMKGKQAQGAVGPSTNRNDRAGLLQRRKREKSILIQFTLISSILLLFYASFWIIPAALPGSTGAVVVTLFGIASSGINPFMYLAFNSLMKVKAKHLILNKLLKRNSNAVTNLQTAPSTSRLASNRKWTANFQRRAGLTDDNNGRPYLVEDTKHR